MASQISAKRFTSSSFSSSSITGSRRGLKPFQREQELSRILGGRKVDLNTPNSLSKYFREQALSEAQVEYVEA
jgi:hypothetical protein